MNRKRLERIWREEGLKVPKKQIKRRRLWLDDGSCLRLRPQDKDHVASLTLLESAGDGLPPVVADAGGNRKIAGDRVGGIVVPRGYEAALSAALAEIGEDAGLRRTMGE